MFSPSGALLTSGSDQLDLDEEEGNDDDGKENNKRKDKLKIAHCKYFWKIGS